MIGVAVDGLPGDCAGKPHSPADQLGLTSPVTALQTTDD